MADISKIKELRTRTGAGIDQCRSALEKADGDLVKALDLLGSRTPRSRQGKLLNSGLVFSYNHCSRIAVIVQVSCETDFVARSEVFIDFVSTVALQVVATSPKYLDQEDRGWQSEANMPISLEGTVPIQQSDVLLEQYAISNESKTIGQLLDDLKLRVGEEVKVVSVVRVELGGETTVIPLRA